ncbi:SagB family peptide dehydrogenase [Amycolatopsis sp. CA-230715]|uniref:SagB family peptide dehydrogenase n=1 Tax=Amycolatopsis sp. CA-230715 TaxID=2745196 RepID=UPI001C01DD68|nr:SagB family peptide dehydrogenase [Amycolatopsis sp. CA-230715]QWF78767.1 hypothetical protein HUW46_02165 [Amycolatopsis sp. CA-230715]
MMMVDGLRAWLRNRVRPVDGREARARGEAVPHSSRIFDACPADGWHEPVFVPRRLWSLREDVLLEYDDDGVTVATEWGDVELGHPGETVREALRRMTLGPTVLTHLFAPDGDGAEWLRLSAVLSEIEHCVVHSLECRPGAGSCLSAVPISRFAGFVLPAVEAEDRMRLSRFAAIRLSGGELVLESPLSRHRVVLHQPPAVSVVGAIGDGATLAQIGHDTGLPADVVQALAEHLAAAGMIVFGEPDDGRGRTWFAEDHDPELAAWSHTDLMFHARTRTGRRHGPIGATFPHHGALPPAPVVKPAPEGERFPLYTPDIAEVARTDGTLTEAMETRRSFHEFAARAPTAKQLGELLFRSARVRSIQPQALESPRDMASDRPYPSMGGRHELELYLTVERCEGLPSGTYHYDPWEHALTRVNDDEAEAAELLDAARVTVGTAGRPPVLITMTGRIARLSWTYSGIAYSTSLKHVGVLQQTLYLVATAMGLAPCALAVGDLEATTRVLRLEWPSEVSVGEFVVGLRAEQTELVRPVAER